MSRIRTVNLELLRHGPSHNQLLSPLTRYIGLCGNHSAATVSVPFEHEHFLGRLNLLRYKDSDETRQIQLKDMAARMSEVLAGIPGLIAELCDGEPVGVPEALTHLQLVLSPSELAFLPFELASAPDGFPGAGQPLALQKQLPLCLTRQVRRAGAIGFDWPLKPRILFIGASPPAAGKIPFESHLQMIRQVIDPWVHYYEKEDRAERKAKLEPHLVVLPQASIDSIEDACRRHAFTHVHILAHGVKIKNGADVGYGLALHDRHNSATLDRVDGERLAAALRTRSGEPGGGLSSPAVVSLAACDSGQVGSVVGAGASVAHTLHAAGIPLVVASQFPLSFEGSVVMVETLYRGLLEGEDPRQVLSDLRQLLRAKVPESHDWASLVAYAALPADLEIQLPNVRLKQASRSIDAAIDWIDQLLGKAEEMEEDFIATSDQNQQAVLGGRQLAEFEDGFERLTRGMARLRRLLADKDQATTAKIWGLLGSGEKRKAQLLYQLSNLVEEARYESYRARSKEALERAIECYENGFEADRSSHWNLIQWLSLAVLLKVERDDFDDLLQFARMMSWFDIEYVEQEECADWKTIAWAHGSLAEISMLSVARRGSEVSPPVVPVAEPPAGDPPADDQPGEAHTQAVHHARELVRIMGRDSFHAYSTRRQFKRYLEWYLTMWRSHADIEAMVPIAEAVLEELPRSPKWE
ncbi:MAG: CHAT domain-containing protein [Acidobacteriota bacterium]